MCWNFQTDLSIHFIYIRPDKWFCCGSINSNSIKFYLSINWNHRILQQIDLLNLNCFLWYRMTYTTQFTRTRYNPDIQTYYHNFPVVIFPGFFQRDSDYLSPLAACSLFCFCFLFLFTNIYFTTKHLTNKHYKKINRNKIIFETDSLVLYTRFGKAYSSHLGVKCCSFMFYVTNIWLHWCEICKLKKLLQ